MESGKNGTVKYLSDATHGAQGIQERIDVTLKMADAVELKAMQVSLFSVTWGYC